MRLRRAGWLVLALALGAGCKRAPRRAGPSPSAVARWAEAEGPPCNPQGMCWHWPQPAGDLEGVWAASPEQVWVVGSQGLLAHYTDHAWRPVHTDVTSDLTAVWGASASDVWAVGDVGVILRWDGKLWTRPKFTGPRGLPRADLAIDLTAEINQKIDAGEITVPDDEYKMPPALEYDYYRLSAISEFENTLFSSFFVTIYFYLESELTKTLSLFGEEKQ